MEILYLLGHALGCAPMYWGLTLLGLVIVGMIDAGWSWLTKQEWPILSAIGRWKLYLIVPVLVHVWFAAYAALLVDGALADASAGYAAVLQMGGLLSVALSAVVFHGVYALLGEVYSDWKPTALVGAGTLAAYGLFLAWPHAADPVTAYWPHMLQAVAAAMAQSALE